MTTPLVPHIAEAPPDAMAPNDPLADFMSQSASPTDDRNWALNDDVKAYIDLHLLSMLPQVRQDMSALHEEWRAVARMAALIHDKGQSYIGRSKVYIPSYARARKTLVSSLSQGLFPTDDYMSVTSRERPTDSAPVDALAVKTYIQWDLNKNARLRRQMKPFLGNFIDYGFTVAKYWYEKETAGPRQIQMKFKPGTKMTYNEYKGIKCREGLRFSPRSVFDFYVFPYNINQLEEATLIFEDLQVSRAYILERQRKKEWENCPLMLEAPEVSEANTNEQEMQSENIKTATNLRAHAGSNIGDILIVTEIWCDLILPKAAYTKGEVDAGLEGTPIPCKVVVGGDVIAEVRRNPFWHQTAPYLEARDDPKAGSFFSKGTGHLVRGIQYLVNDFSNQMNDNGTMGLNPMVLVNPSTLAGPLTPIKPGGIWMTTDVQNGIKFDRPPIEQVQYGMNLVSLYAGMLADHSGATPSLQGQNAGKGGKTATGMQLLQKNAMNPLKDMVEDIEDSVFTPLMFGCWILGQQYRDTAFMIEVMGDVGQWNPKGMKKSQLIGDFLFQWMASNQAANSQQRAAQGMQLLQGLTPPIVQLLIQNGHQVDPYALIKRIYQDLMGFRDFDKFILPKAMLPQQMGPNGEPMIGANGESPDAGGQDPRSAAVQNPNGAEEEASTMAPGEGDEFAMLRQQVEGMAGEQGEEIPE